MSNIKNVAIIGTGVIGTGWVIRCLAHGKKVRAYDFKTCHFYTKPTPPYRNKVRIPGKA